MMMQRCRVGGWTVIEFIIALLLGLVLTLAASGLLLAAASNYRNHGDQVWMDDSGRYALAVIAQAVRQSAYLNWDADAAPVALDAAAVAAVAGLDAASISRGSDGIATALPPVAHGSDVLALRFAGSGEGGNGDGSSLNCAGFGVAAPHADSERGWSIFYVAQDSSGVAELRCKYRGAAGWGADAIVRGVESFQVLYGVDTDTSQDGMPNTYMNADAVNALDDALVLAGATAAERLLERNRRSQWKRVCSIKVALLLRGDAATRIDDVPRQFDLFGAAYSDAHPEDVGVRVAEASLPPAEKARVRRLFSATIALRNRGG